MNPRIVLTQCKIKIKTRFSKCYVQLRLPCNFELCYSQSYLPEKVKNASFLWHLVQSTRTRNAYIDLALFRKEVLSELLLQQKQTHSLYNSKLSQWNKIERFAKATAIPHFLSALFSQSIARGRTESVFYSS
jgi:hypothetical protein